MKNILSVLIVITSLVFSFSVEAKTITVSDFDDKKLKLKSTKNCEIHVPKNYQEVMGGKCSTLENWIKTVASFKNGDIGG